MRPSNSMHHTTGEPTDRVNRLDAKAGGMTRIEESRQLAHRQAVHERLLCSENPDGWGSYPAN